MGLFLFLVLSYVLMSGSCLFGPYLLFLLSLSFYRFIDDVDRSGFSYMQGT